MAWRLTLFSEKTLQTLTTSVCFCLLIFAAPIGFALMSFLLMTRWWYLVALLYLIWMYHDRKTPETGGRPNEFLLSLPLWRYYNDYFPAKLTIAPEVKLDSRRNYLFSYFPHGLFPLGAFNLMRRGSEFRQRYPEFEVHVAVLNLFFYIPFMRDLSLAMGLVSCSKQSLDFLLSRPGGGQVVVLFPGGATESFNVGNDEYKFHVKNRRGFIRVALENGAALVPCITFGENNLFRQFQHGKLRRFQECVKEWLGFAPVVFYGRGFTESSFGVFPMRHPLRTVCAAIEVEKRKNPTNEEIDLLHRKFIHELVRLFETYKNEFLEKPQPRLLLE